MIQRPHPWLVANPFRKRKHPASAEITTSCTGANTCDNKQNAADWSSGVTAACTTGDLWHRTEETQYPGPKAVTTEDLWSGLGVRVRWSTYFVSCRRRAFEASPAPRPRYHLNITWEAAVCRRLYFYTTEIICGQSQRTRSHGRRYGSRATQSDWTTVNDTCRQSDAHGANDGRSARGVPLGLRPAPRPRPVHYAPLHSLHMAPPR